MGKRKTVRTRGKLQLSVYFQEFKPGDFVAVIKEPSMTANFPARLQGRTGVVESKRGRAYMIKVNDMEKAKQYLIEPIHLKKIMPSKK